MKTYWIHSRRRISKSKIKRLYLRVLPTVRRIARECGYAAAVHGSMTRDLDVVAVPWIKRPKAPMTLAVRLSAALSKHPKTAKAFRRQGFGNKPHGRLCFVIFLGCHAARTRNPQAIYVDLSVIPPRPS